MDSLPSQTPTSRRLSTWALRTGYGASLAIIGLLCAYFFFEQRSQNISLNRIGALGEQFAVLDTQMAEIAVKAEGVARTFPPERLRPAFQRGMMLAERRERQAAQPVDPEIRSVQKALLFRLEAARADLDRLKRLWQAVPNDLREQIATSSDYMASTKPFQHHDVFVDPTRLESARTPFDMHWSARELASLYENNVARSNRHAQIEIRKYVQELSGIQGDTLERFLLITMLSLISMLFVIFIPVDIAIQKMLRAIDDKRREADAAMVEALAADRAKSEFLANMSHEIRTPMNGVLGMAELLAKTDLTAKQRTFADVIVKSGNALLTIINDILDFSKIDADQIALDRNPFHLAETVEDVATLVSGRVAEKDLELIVRIQPDLPAMVVGDVGRLRQILTNLVGNAVKFTEVGHVLIDVSGTADDDTASLVFTVEDTGIGIPDEKLAHVFDKFSQVDGSSTRRHEGTGLGLAIARRLVELMGGEIGVESRFGTGSRFFFSIGLPVHNAILQKSKVAPSNISDAGVLVIEDNPVNRAILIEQLESWSFDCAAVEDGASGLTFLREAHAMGAKVDLVILDYQMPEMTGADVARAIRRDPGLTQTPILVLSSVDQMAHMQFVKELAIEGHLNKPTRSSLLLETITDIIQTSRERRKTAPNEPAKADAAPQPATHANTSVVTIAPHRPAGEAIDILVAEDNEVNQIVFTQALEELPYSFQIVGNGRLALMKWDVLRPALILMDVSMPEMNGHEATRAIRAREAELGLARTPIVGVTAHALNGDREACLEAGMDDYLSKPISPDMLARKVAEWLDGDSARKSA